MEQKLTLQVIYGARMNAFRQVVVKIWTCRKLSFGYVLDFDL